MREVYNCIDYDALGHPLYVVRNEGKTVYLWSYNYLHLAAEIKGATISEVRTAMGNLKQQSMIFLQMYAPEKMKRYLSIQRISIRQTSMQKMSV